MTNQSMSTVDVKLLLNEITKTKNSLSTDRLDMSFGEIINMYGEYPITSQNPHF